MSDNTFKLNTPVAMLVFNRPEKTRQVFEAVKAFQPPKLYVVADGPRPDAQSDSEKCQQTRAVFEAIDWPCELMTNYADQNMGCRKRISSGLDWAFEHEEQIIILEDDCLPHPDFFAYCEDLLTRYQDDERIMMISGYNMFGSWDIPEDAYYLYCPFSGVWGWASWRRAWQHYDENMSDLESEASKAILRDALQSKRRFQTSYSILSKTKQGVIDTWDYQWDYAKIMQSGLTIVPARSLVKNIGYDAEASRTTEDTMDFTSAVFGPLPSPLRHPKYVAPNPEYTRAFLFKTSVWWRAYGKLRRIALKGLRKIGLRK